MELQWQRTRQRRLGGHLLAELFILYHIFLFQKAAAFVVQARLRPRQNLPPLLSFTDGIGIGIDLGTTYSAVAFLKDESPTIISIPDNGRTLPSVVAFEDDNILVGKSACERETEVGAYRNVKRVLGTGGKVAADVAKVIPYLAVNPNGKTYKKDSLMNQIHDAKEYPTLLKSSSNETATIRPEAISAHILRTLKAVVEEYTGETVTRAVVGVPAYFHDAQREATQKAAEMAGIPKVKLLREPEAAALAYGIGKEQIGLGDEDELVLVFDLGGGTFDVSMLLVGGGLTEIISTSGNVQLGGSDFDNRIAQQFLKLLREHGISTKKWSEEAVNAVIRSSEQVRIYLSNNRRANLALPISEEVWGDMDASSSVILPLDYSDMELAETGTANSTHIIFQLSRKNMERLCKEEFQALLRPVREVAIMSGALLPGDSSPTLVEAALELEEEEQAREAELAFDDFYKEDNNEEIDSELLLQLQEMDTREAKKAQQRGRKRARNVAKQERKFREQKRKLEESNRQKDEGVKVRDGITGRPISRVVLVGGATRMPAIGRLLAALTGVVPQKTVNPDEAVALGCAVHVGVLDGMENMGTVLNPMQAAILRAVAVQEGRLSEDDMFDDDDFESVEYY